MNSVHPLNVNSAEIFLMVRNPSLLQTLLKIDQQTRSLHLSLYPTPHCYTLLFWVNKIALLPLLSLLPISTELCKFSYHSYEKL